MRVKFYVCLLSIQIRQTRNYIDVRLIVFKCKDRVLLIIIKLMSVKFYVGLVFRQTKKSNVCSMVGKRNLSAI